MACPAPHISWTPRWSHAFILLLLVCNAAGQTRTATRTGSPTSSSTSSVSYSGTSSPSASVTGSVSPTGTPTPSRSFSGTPTPSVTPSSTPFACPVQLTVTGALPRRPLVAPGILECAGHGSCARDASQSTAGRCVCAGNWTGTGCETCAAGMFQTATCASCSSGVGTCVDTSNMCNAGPCSPSQLACASGNASSPLYRTTTCVACPGALPASSGSATLVPCNGRGRCDAYRGQCYCNAGWTGSACTLSTPTVPLDACDGVACSGNGVCTAGSCTCAPGFTGVACEVRTTLRATYVWRPNAWDACSRDCGRGATQRNADCLLVVTDVAGNAQNVTTVSTSLCDPFTRPATTQDCRTFACGASFASIVIGLSIDPSLATSSDATLNAVATGVVNDVAAIVVAAYPGSIPVAEAQARVYVSSIAAAAVTPGVTLIALEVQSVSAASAAASTGNSVTGLLMLAAVTVALTNTSRLAVTVGSTYLRRAAPLQIGDVAAFLVANATLLSNGIAILNATSTTALTPSAVETSLLGTLPPGIIAAIVVGLVVSIALVGLILIAVWRYSLKSGSVKPLAFTGRDRRISGRGSDIAIVVRKDKNGEVVIVRNDSKSADMARRGSSDAMGGRRGSAVNGMGTRKGSAVDGMGSRRGSAVDSSSIGGRRGSGLLSSGGSSGGAVETRRASFVGRGAGIAGDFVSRRGSAIRQASPDITDGAAPAVMGKRASFVHEVGMGGFAGSRAVTRGRLPSDSLQPPERPSSRSSQSSGGSSSDRGRSRQGRRHGVELHTGAAPGITGRDDWMPKADDGKSRRKHHKSSAAQAPAGPDLTDMANRRGSIGADMRKPTAARLGGGRRSLIDAGAAVVATSPPVGPSRRRSMEMRTPMTSPSGVDAGNVASIQRSRLPPLDALPHGHDVVRLGSDLGIIDRWVAAPITERGPEGPSGVSDVSGGSEGASRTNMHARQSSMNDDSYADANDRVADFYAEANM